MATEVLLLMFLKAQAAASCTILLIIALRLPVRRLFGAELGYSLWLLAPAAGLSSLFPSLSEIGGLKTAPSGLLNAVTTLGGPLLQHADWIAFAWLGNRLDRPATGARSHR